MCRTNRLTNPDRDPLRAETECGPGHYYRLHTFYTHHVPDPGDPAEREADGRGPVFVQRVVNAMRREGWWLLHTD